MAINLPEIELYNILNQIFSYIKTDFANESNEKNSVLYRLFKDKVVEQYDFYEQAKALFLRGDEDARVIGVRLFFDRNRAHIPTVHLSLPSENDAGGPNGIGIDEGYAEQFVDEGNHEFANDRTRSYNTKFNFVITSDNPFEVIMMYHTIKCIIVGFFDHLAHSGIHNPKISGQDLQLNDNNMPTNIFTRAIGIDCFYDQTVPDHFKHKMLNDITLGNVKILDAISSTTVLGEFDFTVPIYLPVKITDCDGLHEVAAGGTYAVNSRTIQSSDELYKVLLTACSLTLPDIIHIDSDLTPTPLPAQTPMVCQPLANGNVRNTNSTYTDVVAPGATLILPDIIHIDSDGLAAAAIPAQTPFVATLCPVKAGWFYQKPLWTGQKVSYEDYDDGWQYLNGTYNYTYPVNPISHAMLDFGHASPFFNLVENNIHGNKTRFTDQSGTQIYVDDIIENHLAGQMWYRVPYIEGVDWATMLANANAKAIGGYNDWRLPDTNTYESISNRSISASLANVYAYAPFNFVASQIFASSTTRKDATTQNLRFQPFRSGQIANDLKTNTTRNYYIVRDF